MVQKNDTDIASPRIATRLFIRNRRVILVFFAAVVLISQFITYTPIVSYVSRLSETSSSPRVLYYNRHSACTNNMAYVTSRLGLKFTQMRPGFLGDLGMRQGRANDIINDGFVQVVCASADIIIISDTLPDARPLLQSLLRTDPNERCKSNIVIELTNRFDWGVFDFDEYHKLIWELVQAKPKNLFWVANNAFEAKVMADDCNANPEFRILRPSGFSDVPEREVSDAEKSTALMRELDSSEVLGHVLNAQVPFSRVVGHYGGPHTLKKYKAYIEFPYQVSTMKLYENLAAGVPMLIPTPRFFQELVEKRIHAFGPWEMLRRMGPDWFQYMDYYIADFKPYIHYFDSFEQLNEILQDPNFDAKAQTRTAAPAMYQKIVSQMLNGWSELFEEMGYKVLVDGKPRAIGSGVSVQKFVVDVKYQQPTDAQGWEQVYEKIKTWKTAQRTEQLEIWDKNEKSLNAIELKIKDAAKKGSVEKYLKEKKMDETTLIQVRALDFLNGEFGKTSGLFGGTLKNVHDIDITVELSKLLDKYNASSKNLLFKASDFNKFGYLARYLHIFDAALQKSKSDVTLASQISSVQSRLELATKTLSLALYPWLPNHDIGNLASSFRGRGIVLTFPTSGYSRGVHLILTIRNILKCNLPIEIFYIGDKDLSLEKRQKLANLPNVKTINILDKFPKVEEVHGFNIKPFVILASSFSQVVFLDDDVTLLQSPDKFIKESVLFKKYGTMYFLDRSFSHGNSEWVKSFITLPSLVAENSRYMTEVSRDEQESSMVVLDKGRLPIIHALLSACHMNLKDSRDNALHVHTHGDKESFWIAHEMVRAPYNFIPGIGGAAGFFRTKDGVQEPEVVCGPQSHIDETGRLIHFNGLVVKSKDDFSHGYLDFHHFVAPILENPGNVDIGYSPWCVHSRLPKKEIFEMSWEEKETLRQIIELHKELRDTDFEF